VSGNQQTKDSGCSESERIALITGYPDNHCLLTRYPDNRYEKRNLTLQSPKSENLRKITYEIISVLCKTNPILSAVGGLQMNVNIYDTKIYQNETAFRRRKNKANSNPIKPNLRKAKMNVNLTLTKDYRKKDDFVVRINKPIFRNGQNECNLKYNKGLWQFSDRDSEKTNPNKPNFKRM